LAPGLAWIPQVPGQWHRYPDGYREAAEWLHAKWREGPIQPDYLAYPMVYLYRHYTELMLKEFLQSATQSGLIELPKDWKCDHGVKTLWDTVKPLIRRLWPDEPERDTENAQQLIYEFHVRDPISQEFRYPTDRSDKQHLADMDRLDIANFFDAMRGLAAYLDSVSSAFIEYLAHHRTQ